MNVFSHLLADYPILLPIKDQLTAAYTLLVGCFADDGKLLVCGNGGSAADAMHMVGELMKEFLLPRPVPKAFRAQLHTQFGEAGDEIAAHLQGALPALSLVGETALGTAFSNDCAYEYAFAQQVYGHGKKGDVLLAISTSGNSKNVLAAAQTALAKGLQVIALTGQDGGSLKELCDVLINVPASQPCRIQELHLPIYHALCRALEEHFFG